MKRNFFAYQKYFSLLLIFLLSVALSISQLSEQTHSCTKWYVNKNATGANNGLTWTNAWSSFASINWAIIGAGDTIFVSGGSTSQTYNAADGKGIRLNGVGVDDGIITITKGRDSGHNGSVIFSPTVGGYPSAGLYLDNYTQNIVLDSLTFKWELTTATGSALSFGNMTDNCSVKNSQMISNGNAHALNLYRVTNISIIGNEVETLSNNYTAEQDGIYISSGGGGHTITGNSIILRGTNATPHIDIIQMYAEGQDNYYLTTIANNYFSNRTHANGIYVNAAGSNRFLIYNNVGEMYNTAGGFTGCLSIANNGTYTQMSLQLYNNTFVTGGTNQVVIYVSKVDSFIMKNNIVLKDSGSYNALKFGYGLSEIGYKDIDYNQYFVRTGTAYVDTLSDNHITFAAFQSLGYEVNGEAAEPDFVSKWVNNLATDWKLNSSGIDDGTNIAIFNSDIVGNLRPQVRAWDRGAFEFPDTIAGGDIIHPDLPTPIRDPITKL